MPKPCAGMPKSWAILVLMRLDFLSAITLPPQQRQRVGQAITPCWNSTGEQPSTWGHSVRSLLK